MKALLLAGACTLALCVSAAADPWVDYTPQKGVYSVTGVKVEPSKVDDYLKGLKKVWAPGEEYAKKQGIIDGYEIMLNVNGTGPGPNILLIEHLTSFAQLDPNKKRDLDMQKAFEAIVPKAESDTAVANFDKYRVFTGTDLWQVVELTK